MVGPVTENPLAGSSHTHASPLSWLAITLSSRSRIGSARALNIAASRSASSIGRGSRSKGEHYPPGPVQDKVWVHEPGAEPWEVYTVLSDAPGAVNIHPETGDCLCA